MKHALNTIALTVVAAIAHVASGQSTQIPAPAQTGPVVVVDAVLHPVSTEHPERIEDGWVRFQDGRIVAIGSGDPPADQRDDATIVDAAGLSLVPGFISVPSQVGLLEVGAVSATDDRRESGDRSRKRRRGSR